MFEQVAQIIGKANAAKLQAVFGCQSIYIPCQRDVALAKRNARIRQLYRRKANAWSIARLMDEFELSKRQIWNVLKESA